MNNIRYGPPLKLYDLCINAAIVDCTSSSECLLRKRDFRALPNTSLMDFYERLFQDRRLCILNTELSDLDIFIRLLYVKSKRSFLIHCYQALINHTRHHTTGISQTLLKTFLEYVAKTRGNKTNSELIDIGIKMGIFLNDGAWFDYSMPFLDKTEELILQSDNCKEKDNTLLECYRLRLYAESHYCTFPKAKVTFEKACQIIKNLSQQEVSNLASIYSSFSMYYFIRSDYNESYEWSVKALQALTANVNKRVLTDILRQASKSCVVKRKFAQAGFLIRQAMILGDILYKKQVLPSFASIYMDYGFYLLNSDAVSESVMAYETALKFTTQMFKKNNIHIAIGHEDLAYALYVNEYSSGNFWPAKEHAERSIETMENVLPKDHLLLASVKRVKALILEEMALDERSNYDLQSELLCEAEKLHKAALSLSRQFFGDKNIQTAKHYGNLGRLYQSMKMYDKAEKMHLKAIAIKEELLGPKDYEVGLSIGHLASLYNYHMKKYQEAEHLYLRSIEINLYLFGPSYSGLEYDYRGLINVYNKLVDGSKVVFYYQKYNDWKKLRDKMGTTQPSEQLLPPQEITKMFFELDRKQQILEEEKSQWAKKIMNDISFQTELETYVNDLKKSEGSSAT